MQAMLRLVYPPRCLSCDTVVQEVGALCGACRRDTPFLSGQVCDLCGAELMDDPTAPQIGRPLCDECRVTVRPWAQGRAALAYAGRARRLILAFKHGDRLDLAEPLARWLERAAAPLLRPDTALVPVPVHWTRLVKRRFNQSAELARIMARNTGHDFLPDALWRKRRTRPHEGMSRAERFRNVAGTIEATTRGAARLKGRDVLLIDDVMTTGATLSAAAEAAHVAGARRVCVAVLARVAKTS